MGVLDLLSVVIEPIDWEVEGNFGGEWTDPEREGIGLRRLSLIWVQYGKIRFRFGEKEVLVKWAFKA